MKRRGERIWSREALPPIEKKVFNPTDRIQLPKEVEEGNVGNEDKWYRQKDWKLS